MHIEWTKEEDDICLIMYEQKHSYSVIGRRIKRSRSAVSGRIYRLRSHVVIPYQEKKARRVKKKPLQKIATGAVALRHVDDSQCKYLIDGLCCGEPMHKKSFCEYHYSICYTKAS